MINTKWPMVMWFTINPKNYSFRNNEYCKKMKLGKEVGPSEVNTEMTVASSEIGVEVMMILGQRVLNGKGIPDETRFYKE